MARPASDIRERLLESALHHFAEVGVDAASLRKIAQGAGTSVGMISYHFESKDGLFFTLARNFYSQLVEDLEELARSHEDPVERLRHVLRRLAKLYDTELLAARMVLRELSVESSRVKELMPMVFDGHIRLLVTTLNDAIEAGDFRPVPVLETLPSLLAPLIAPQILRIPVLLGLDADKAADAAIDVMLHGLMRRDPSAGHE